MRRPSLKDGRCAKCGSDNLMSWTNDHVVICEDCGQNHAWPRSGAFYRGGGWPYGADEPRDEDRPSGFGLVGGIR